MDISTSRNSCLQWTLLLQGCHFDNFDNFDNFDHFQSFARTADEKLLWAFKLYDTDNSGVIDRLEMRNIMEVMTLVDFDQLLLLTDTRSIKLTLLLLG